MPRINLDNAQPIKQNEFGGAQMAGSFNFETAKPMTQYAEEKPGIVGKLDFTPDMKPEKQPEISFPKNQVSYRIQDSFGMPKILRKGYIGGEKQVKPSPEVKAMTKLMLLPTFTALDTVRGVSAEMKEHKGFWSTIVDGAKKGVLDPENTPSLGKSLSDAYPNMPWQEAGAMGAIVEAGVAFPDLLEDFVQISSNLATKGKAYPKQILSFNKEFSQRLNSLRQTDNWKKAVTAMAEGKGVSEAEAESSMAKTIWENRDKANYWKMLKRNVAESTGGEGGFASTGLRQSEKIESAVIQIGDKLYSGADHGIAIQKAAEAGEDISNIVRETAGMFLTNKGRVLNRDQAEQEFGIRHAHEIPMQKPRGIQEEKPKAEVFYSSLQKSISEKMPNQAPASQVKGILESSGIPKDQLDWVDVDSFLKGKDVVKKQDLLDYIKQNDVKVDEVVKGGGADERNSYKLFEEADSLLNQAEGYRESGDNKKASELMERAVELRKQGNKNQLASTKFHNYQLPGGENYKELLLTIPDTGSKKHYVVERKELSDSGDKLYDVFGPDGNSMMAFTNKKAAEEKAHNLSQMMVASPQAFRDSHFDEPNVLAHIRFNDRTDSEGNKVLFIEEVQSDWHQKGRKEGYQRGQITTEEQKFLDLDKRASSGTFREEELREYDKLYDKLWNQYSNDMPEGRDSLREFIQSKKEGVPNAPFKKTWHELALKRMLRYAAENGYDKIAWTTGEQQAERYDLSKQIERLDYSKNDDGTFNIQAVKDGVSVVEKEDQSKEEIANLVGKEIAEKMDRGEGLDGSNSEYGDFKTLSGIDLKVGGEGMKGFYDQIIPSFLNKYTKKWGGKVSTSEIGKDTRFSSGEKLTSYKEALAHLKKGNPLWFKLLEDDTEDGGESWSAYEGIGDFKSEYPTEKDFKERAPDLFKEMPEGSEPSLKSHSLELTKSMKESVLFEGQKFKTGLPDSKTQLSLINKAKDIIKELAPKGTDYIFKENLTIDGSSALGYFTHYGGGNGLIALDPASGEIVSTAFHEVGHAVLNMTYTKPEIKDILSEVIKEWNEPDELAAEEAIMNEAHAYHQEVIVGGKTEEEFFSRRGKTFTEKMKDFIRQMVARVKSWLKLAQNETKMSKLKEFYRDMFSGARRENVIKTDVVSRYKLSDFGKEIKAHYGGFTEQSVRDAGFNPDEDFKQEGMRSLISKKGASFGTVAADYARQGKLPGYKEGQSEATAFLDELKRQQSGKVLPGEEARQKADIEGFGPPVAPPPDSPETSFDFGDNVPGRFIKARIKQLQSESLAIEKQLSMLQSEKNKIAAGGLPTSEESQKLRGLQKKYDQINGQIADLMLNKQSMDLIKKKVVDMKVGEILKYEARAEAEGFRSGAAEMEQKKKEEISSIMTEAKAKRYIDKLVADTEKEIAVEEQKEKTAAAEQKIKDLRKEMNLKISDIKKELKTEAQVKEYTASIEKKYALLSQKQAHNELIGKMTQEWAQKRALDKERLRVKREIQKMVDDINRMPTKALPLEYKDMIDEVKSNFDFSRRTAKTLVNRESMSRFVKRMEDSGQEISIPQEQLDMLARIPLNDMTFDDLKDIHEQIMRLYHQGTLKDKLLKSMQNRKFEEVLKEGVEVINQGKISKPLESIETYLKNQDKSIAHLTKEALSSLVLENLRPELMYNVLDEYNPNGVNTKVVWDTLNDSRNNKSVAIHESEAKLAEILKPALNPEWFAKKYQVGRFNDMTKEIAMDIYTQSFNEDNLAHIQASGITDKDIQDISNFLSDQEKGMALDLFDYYENYQYPRIAKPYERINGVHLPLVKNYFPIMGLDPEVDILQRGKRYRPSVDKGFTQERVRSKLELKSFGFIQKIYSNLQKVEHYIAFSEAVRDANKYLSNPEIKSAIVNTHGQKFYSILQKHLQDVAFDGADWGKSWIDGLSKWIRTNYGTAVLGFNFKTMLKQPIALLQGMEMAGKQETMKSLLMFGRHPNEMLEFVMSRSVIMKYRSMTQEREFREIIAQRKLYEKFGKAATGYQGFKEWSMLPIQIADRYTAAIVWFGSYQESIKNGIDEVAAVKEADRVVRRTQPMGDTLDLPSMFRGPEYQKLITFVQGHTNKFFNLQYEMAGKSKRGQYTNGQVISKLIFFTILPAIAVFTIDKQRLPKDVREFVDSVLEQVSQGLVPVNKIVQMSIGKGWTEITPIEAYFKDLKKLMTGKTFEKKVTGGVDLLSAIYGFPIVGIRRILSGQLLGKPPKDKKTGYDKMAKRGEVNFGAQKKGSDSLGREASSLLKELFPSRRKQL